MSELPDRNVESIDGVVAHAKFRPGRVGDTIDLVINETSGAVTSVSMFSDVACGQTEATIAGRPAGYQELLIWLITHRASVHIERSIDMHIRPVRADFRALVAPGEFRMSHTIDMANYSGSQHDLLAALAERAKQTALNDEKDVCAAASRVLDAMGDAYYQLSLTADRSGGGMTAIEHVHLTIRKVGAPGGG